jgi:hypothetical protein
LFFFYGFEFGSLLC